MAQSNWVTIESVNNYGGNGDLQNSILNGTGFQNGMTASGTWVAGYDYRDPNVWDTDFVDPDRTNNSWDDDTYNFDQLGTGISYFTGHGVCDGSTNQVCATTADCTSPGAGQSMPGSCKDSPNWPTPLCHYFTPRYLVTHGAGDHYGGYVNYSNGYVKFGESSQSGSWGGAATNGGVNLVVLDESCGVLPEFWLGGLGPMFAGVHFVATLMPVSGDTDNVSNRGSTFAARWQANPNEAVADAWVNTLYDLPAHEGDPCGPNYQYGGGHGMNSCGANFVMTMDDCGGKAYNKINNESWYGLQDDANDATSASCYYWKASCNYDCRTYPWQL